MIYCQIKRSPNKPQTMSPPSIDTADKTDYSKPSARRRERNEQAMLLKATLRAN